MKNGLDALVIFAAAGILILFMQTGNQLLLAKFSMIIFLGGYMAGKAMSRYEIKKAARCGHKPSDQRR